MKKIVFLLFIISLFVFTGCIPDFEEKPKDALVEIQNRGKITVGYIANSKPFAFKDKNNQPIGFDIDLTKQIAKNILGKSSAVDFVETTVYDSMSTVSSGKVDFLISAMTITPQRKLVVDFSEPYYTTTQAILVPKNSPISTIKDLNKKRVLVQLNSTSEQTPKKYAPAAITLGVKSSDTAFSELKNGLGDALISDEVLLKGFLSDNPNYKILPFKLTSESYAIILKNTPETTALRIKINTALQTMKKDGTIQKLKEKWNL